MKKNNSGAKRLSMQELTSAFVRITKSTLQYHNALYNSQRQVDFFLNCILPNVVGVCVACCISIELRHVYI